MSNDYTSFKQAMDDLIDAILSDAPVTDEPGTDDDTGFDERPKFTIYLVNGDEIPFVSGQFFHHEGFVVIDLGHGEDVLQINSSAVSHIISSATAEL